jgi:ClpP class serine protease
MDKHFLNLITENFYASADSMRNFFMLGTDEKAFSFDDLEKKETIISSYGTEYNTIHITGMMLREQSWITDLGFATSTEQVIEGIQETLAEGKKVKLIINSGGGLVTGTSNLADIIYENRDQIEAYATGVVASAAMWVYSAAGIRYAEATTVMGSIGVVTSVFDDELYWKSYGIIWKEVVSENAKNKRPDMKTEEGQNEIKRYLTSLEAVFIDAVSTHLDMSRDDVISKFHEGGLITGSDALAMEVIDSLTSYNLEATMPSVLSAGKIETKPNIGEDVMEITQEEFDAMKAKIATAEKSNTVISAEKETLEDSLATATVDLTKATADLTDANAKLAGMGEIVGMAFEHKVNKATAIAMIGAGTKEAAAVVVLSSKATTGSTAKTDDIDNSEGDDKATEDAEELQAAIDYAKKISVNKK